MEIQVTPFDITAHEFTNVRIMWDIRKKPRLSLRCLNVSRNHNVASRLFKHHTYIRIYKIRIGGDAGAPKQHQGRRCGLKFENKSPPGFTHAGGTFCSRRRSCATVGNRTPADASGESGDDLKLLSAR